MSDYKNHQTRKRAIKSTRGGIRWRLLLALAILLGFIWFAPALVAKTPLRGTLIGWLNGQINGTIAIDSIHAGWLSPVIAEGIEITDNNSDVVAAIDTLQSEKNLMNLVTNSSDLGVIDVKSPQLNVQLTADNSNIEQLIEPLMNQPSNGSTKPAITFRLTNGRIRLKTLDQKEAWDVDHCDAEVQLFKSPNEILAGTLSAAISESGKSPGKLDAELKMSAGDKPEASDAVRSAGFIKTERLALDFLNPIFKRIGLDVVLGGAVTGEVHAEYASQDEFHVDIHKIDGREIRVTAPHYLGKDTIQSSTLTGSGKIDWNGSELQLTDVAVQSDLATCDANGKIALASLDGSGPWQTLVSQLAENDFRAQAQLDVARLAAVLPNLLKIRDDTHITAGQLRAQLTSENIDGHRQWVGEVEAKSLAAITGGQALSWDNPIKAEFSGRRTDDGIELERIQCVSDFLSVNGHGSISKGELAAKGDLKQLFAQFNRVIDLGVTRLDGTFQANAKWQQNDANALVVEGDATLDKVAIEADGMQPLSEDHLELSFAASGDIQQGKLNRLDSARLNVVSAEDSLFAVLTDSVKKLEKASVFPLDVRVEGHLAQWFSRVQTVAPLADWTASGKLKLEASGAVGTQLVRINSAKVDVEQFKLTGPRVNIIEAAVLADFSGAWEQDKKRLAVKNAVLQSSSFAARGQQIETIFKKDKQDAIGTISFRGDLARINNWFQAGDASSPYLPAGIAVGSLKLTHEQGKTRADVSANVSDFSLAKRATPTDANENATKFASAPSKATTLVWQEKHVQLSGSAIYQHAESVLDLEQAEIKSDTMLVQLIGDIKQPTGAVNVDLKADVQYDWKRIVERLQNHVGRNVVIEGEQRHRFAIKGPLRPRVLTTAAMETNEPIKISTAVAGKRAQVELVSADLSGFGSLGWDRANVFNMALGKGEVVTRLKNKILLFDPIEFDMNGGKFTAAPQILLNHTPPVLVLPKAPLLQYVSVSPELCRGWLKFVAPLVADATEAKGRFSVNLEKANVPLTSSLDQATVYGRLALHNAEIGPGPVAQQIQLIAGQLQALIDGQPLKSLTGAKTDPWLRLPSQHVTFHLEEGRVHHEGLQMNVGDITIRTRGHVGLDESIALVAEIPIRDNWITKNKALEGLRGQTLKIPIEGTVSKPRVDGRALQDVSKQVLGGAVNRFLGNELNKGLQQLFGPKPKP